MTPVNRAHRNYTIQSLWESENLVQSSQTSGPDKTPNQPRKNVANICFNQSIAKIHLIYCF